VNFSWSAAPRTGVNADNFSVRWTGFVEAPSNGTYVFQTQSNAGVRLWINGTLVIDNWTSHSTATDTAAGMALVKNGRYSVTLEMYDTSGTAVARLNWRKPGDTGFGAVPALRLYAN